jgi:hypothetical protein
VVNTRGAVVAKARPEWSRLSECWSWLISTASTGPILSADNAGPEVLVKVT